MDFIENDKLHVPNHISTTIQHASKNFRRHNHTRRFGSNLDIARQQTDFLVTKGQTEIAKFLVR
jgi:hypothetical protein